MITNNNNDNNLNPEISCSYRVPTITNQIKIESTTTGFTNNITTPTTAVTRTIATTVNNYVDLQHASILIPKLEHHEQQGHQQQREHQHQHQHQQQQQQQRHQQELYQQHHQQQQGNIVSEVQPNFLDPTFKKDETDTTNTVAIGASICSSSMTTGSMPIMAAAGQQPTLTVPTTSTTSTTLAAGTPTSLITTGFMAALPPLAALATATTAATVVTITGNNNNINTIPQQEATAATLTPTPDRSVISNLKSTGYGENRWTKNGFGESVVPLTPETNSIGGKFSTAESELVQIAIEEYCAIKNITPAKMCFESDHRAELKGAWMEIAKKLPHRTVQSVYRHGLRILHPFKRGQWTEDECRQLGESVAQHGKKWSLIQKEINRSADSCRDKYREMAFVKGRWSEEEMKVLETFVRDELRCPPPSPYAGIQDIVHLIESKDLSIPWSNISKKIGTRSRLSCFKKWQKMVKQYNDGNVFVVGQHPQVIVEDKRLQFSQVFQQPSPQQQLQSQLHQKMPPASEAHVLPNIGGLVRSGFLSPHSNMNIANNTNLHVHQQPMNTTTTSNTNNTKQEEIFEQHDINLLQILSSTNTHVYAADIPWSKIPHPKTNAQSRWIELITQENSNMQQLPIFQLAKYILEKKISKAAAAVEAVELPSTKDLLDRIQKVTDAVNDAAAFGTCSNSSGILVGGLRLENKCMDNDTTQHKKRKVDDVSDVSTSQTTV